MTLLTPNIVATTEEGWGKLQVGPKTCQSQTSLPRLGDEQKVQGGGNHGKCSDCPHVQLGAGARWGRMEAGLENKKAVSDLPAF